MRGEVYPAAVRSRPWHLAALSVATAALSVATLTLTFYIARQPCPQVPVTGTPAAIRYYQPVTGINCNRFETTDDIAHGLWAQDYHTIISEIKTNAYNLVRLPFSNQMAETSIKPMNFTANVNRSPEYGRAIQRSPDLRLPVQSGAGSDSSARCDCGCSSEGFR